jgi:segregation and condensation protein B
MADENGTQRDTSGGTVITEVQAADEAASIGSTASGNADGVAADDAAMDGVAAGRVEADGAAANGAAENRVVENAVAEGSAAEGGAAEDDVVQDGVAATDAAANDAREGDASSQETSGDEAVAGESAPEVADQHGGTDALTVAAFQVPAEIEAAFADEPAHVLSAEVKATVEALIFASPDPITPKMLCRLLAEEPKADVLAAIEALKVDYDSRPGLQMVEVAGGYQIVTRPELHDWVRRLFHERSTQKLSVPALESLAVIAYKQPITALEIGEVRGVNTSGVLSTLLERHLIKIVGRKNVVGRPFLYATTKEFLIRFGLRDLNDLPKVDDMAAALGFDPPAGLLEQSPREDVLPLTEADVAAGIGEDVPPAE